MFEHRRRTLRTPLSACLLFVLLTTIPTLGRAGSIDLATELMMGDQEANTLIIGSLFGADPTSPLKFTSTVDTGGQSFSYSLNSGSAYEGQSISLTSIGSLNAAGTLWTLSSNGSLGSSSWSTAGTAAVVTDPNGDTEQHQNYDTFDKFGNKNGDTHIDRVISGKSSTDTGFFTDLSGNKVAKSNFTSTDTLVNGKWDVTTTPINFPSELVFPTFSTGFSPTAGGTGSFTSSFVPEPSSLTLFVLSALGVLGCMRLRRRL
jgi:hypothetical protein